MKLHPSITFDRVFAAVERGKLTLDDPGICIACGLDHDGVEPDARKLPCFSCGESAVYGAWELLFHHPESIGA